MVVAQPTKAFNWENWRAAEERLAYFLKALTDEGYPDDLIAGVAIASGVILIERVYGRDALLRHLARLALKASDPNDDLVPRFGNTGFSL